MMMHDYLPRTNAFDPEAILTMSIAFELACADLQVFGPEVVPPFADAVRLVDRDQRDRDVAEETAEALEHQPLRGHVDERVLASGQPAHAAAGLRPVEGGREEGGAHAARLSNRSR